MPELQDDRNKELFRILVETQDSGMTVSESRAQLASTQNIAIEDVIRIERAGIEGQWPPLDITFLAPEFEKQRSDGTDAT